MRILLSYHYYKNVDIAKLVEQLSVFGQPVDILVDSGAFSAFTLGATIDLNAYTQWVSYWGELFGAFANLDVIGDAEGTLQNQRAIEAMGLKPLPIFHTGEPWEYLDRYLEDYRYVMLGGMVPYARERHRLMPWLIKCFRKAGTQTVYHGLGLTSWYALSAFPWYSVDSSSWGSGYRYGTVPVFDQVAGRMKTVQIGDRKKWAANAGHVRALGFNPADFADRSRTSRALLCQIGAASYVAGERFLRKRHGPITIPGTDASGLRTYFVDGSISNLTEAASGLRTYLAGANGANGADLMWAAQGLRTYLADSNGFNLKLAAGVEP